MRRSVLRCALCSGAAFALLILVGCSSSAPAARNTAASGTPVYDAWTTPPEAGSTYAAQPGSAATLQPAPRAVSPAPASGYASPRYMSPAASSPGVATYPGGTLPPPPPPPGGASPTAAAPVAAGTAATFAAPDGRTPIPASDPRVPAGARGIWVAPQRTYVAGLPCNAGISQWHIRGVAGIATFHGTDPAENCVYYGADIGRSFCGCWGLDLYYRYNSGRFTREPAAGATFEDGGIFHHFGAKVTMERMFSGSNFYWWAGAGAGYFTTQNYVSDDSGPEAFGEAGLGWNFNRNWRVRAGVNVHAMDTTVTRRLPSNDGKSRLLWLVAPVVEVEFSF